MALCENRFSGLRPNEKPLKRLQPVRARYTPLKRMGVRIILWFCIHFPLERSTAPSFP